VGNAVVSEPFIIIHKLNYSVIRNMYEVRVNLFCTIIHIIEDEIKLLTVCKLKCYSDIKG